MDNTSRTLEEIAVVLEAVACIIQKQTTLDAKNLCCQQKNEVISFSMIGRNGANSISFCYDIDAETFTTENLDRLKVELENFEKAIRL